jgi:hypothetical protein
MADIAPKLIQLSADKLRALHERLHKSEASPEVLEVHHLAVNEMLRRGLEAPDNDVWDEFEILVDTMKNANLEALTGSLPADMIADVIKSTGSSVANVQLFLTTTGYEMRLEEVIKKSPTVENVEKAETFVPPMAVRTAARRALDWISEGKAGDGFTGIGRSRAGQLASGEGISLATIKRMKSFLARHAVDKKAIGFSQGEKGFPSAGRVAWDAWGGDAGFRWAETIIARAEKEVAKHNPGQHDQKTHGNWANDVAQDILDGKHPHVEAKNVSAFLMGAAKRTDHPDLTELSVDGTLLFGDEGMGIARKDMPQIPGKERARFLAEIEQSDGITSTAEEVDPTTLKPVQKEISSSRSGAIYNKFREEGGIPQDERILISSDGFVIDGHHTWGASVGFAFDNPGTKIPVYRLSVTAKEALDISLEWSTANGFEGQAIDAPAKKSLAWQKLSKNQEQATRIGAYGVTKADDAKRYTLGAMYIPDRVDAHGEWTDADELQRAVWDYVKTNDRRIRLQHDRDVVAGEWVEVMAFPYELTVPIKTLSGLEVSHTYPPNTVFLGVIWEPWAWKKVQEGEILGYSIGGKAERLYVDMDEVEKEDGPGVNDVHVDTIMNPKKKKPKETK